MHTQVKIFINKKNSGPGISRNLGIIKSKGEFLIFLDSDDTIVPGSLKNLSKIIKQNNYAKLIINNSVRNKPPFNDNHLFYLFNSKEIATKVFLKKSVKYNIHIDEVWKLVVKKNFLQKNNIFFPNIYIGEDQCFILKIFEHSKIIYLNEKFHIKHNYNEKGLSQNIGNLACVSYALVVKFLSLANSKKNYFKTYLDFKIKSLKILSLLHFILTPPKKKIKTIKELQSKKIDTKLFKTQIKFLTNKIFLELKEFNFKSKNKDFFIYCADIYGASFFEVIKKKIKIKNFIDDNKKINKKNILGLKIFNFNQIKFSKKKQSIFFVCIKDLNKYKIIKDKINNSKLFKPEVRRIHY